MFINRKYPIIPSKFLWTEGRFMFLVVSSHSDTGLLSYLQHNTYSTTLQDPFEMVYLLHVKPSIDRLFSRKCTRLKREVVDDWIVCKVGHRCLRAIGASGVSWSIYVSRW